MHAEQVTAAVCFHAEGPTWWPRTHELRWVDMLAHAGNGASVLTLGTEGHVRRIDLNQRVCALLRPRIDQGAVVVTEHDIMISNSDDLDDLLVLRHVLDEPNLRFNEGGCDPEGRLYVGTMPYDRTPSAGAYYRCDEQHITTMIDNLSVSNGIGWSPDKTRCYLSDTPTHRIDVFDYDGGLHSRRKFVDLGKHRSDGLCVDAEGGVWVALIGSGLVRRYQPDGTLSEQVSLPASRVTSCTFGGVDLAELYITTSQEKASDADTGAGAVFACRPGVCGQPVAECRF